MRPSLWATVVLLLVFALAPTSVRAWADASVRSARARVTLEDGVRQRVVLSVDVRVDGGWLEAFELDGLDPGLALDESAPPTFVRVVAAETEGAASSIETLEPRVTSHERGRVSFAFRRRNAPRRGDYRIEVTYVAPIGGAPTAHERGTLLGWTFPAWRFGLDGVEIDLVLPPDSLLDPTFREEATGDAGIVVEEGTTEDGDVLVHLVRHHLPRTRAWPITFIVPSTFVPVPEVDHPEAPAPRAPVAAVPTARVSPFGSLVALVVLFFVVLGKNAVVEREDRESGRTSAVRAFARRLVAMGALALGALSTFFAPAWLPLAVVALALAGLHGPPRERPSLPGAFRPASPSWIRSAREGSARARRSLGALVSAWQLRGRVLLVVAFVALGVGAFRAPTMLPPEHAVLFACALATVLALGRRPLLSGAPRLLLGRLLEHAAALRLTNERLSGVALLPVLFAETNGGVRTARVRFVLDAPPAGLVRFDLTLLDDDRPALVVAARADTEAAVRLSRLAPLCPHGRERVGLVAPTGDDVALAVESVLDALRDDRVRPESVRAAA